MAQADEPPWDAPTHTASIRYCADGGANRVYDVFGDDDACVCRHAASQSVLGGPDWHSKDRFIPDLIKGDLDSLRDDVRQYYASKVRPARLSPCHHLQ